MLVEMQLIIFGAPGVGKGTLSDRLSKRYGIPHISTGGIFRSEIKAGNQELIKFVEKGLLVPDSIVNKIVEKALKDKRCSKGFILDGYPRTIDQADFLEGSLQNLQKKIGMVINLAASEDTIISRLAARRLCSKCGAGYNIVTMKPKKEGICDKCGSHLIQRKDDQPETIKKRVNVYNKDTAPVLEYFRKRGLISEVDASNAPDEVYNDAAKIIDAHFRI